MDDPKELLNRKQQELSCDEIGSDCPRCGGSGIIIKREYIEDMDYETEFAIPCPDCKAKRYKKTDDKYAGIPEQYAQKGYASFNFGIYGNEHKDEMQQIKKLANSFVLKTETWRTERKWLYLWSHTPGTGKTLLSCILANALKDEYRTRFVTAPEYLASCLKDKEEQGDRSKQYRECEFLILDDLGSQKHGEWQDEQIFRLIDERSKRYCLTIITSNLAIKELKLPDRTISRIMSMSVEIELPEVPVRELRTQDKQKDFLLKVL